MCSYGDKQKTDFYLLESWENLETRYTYLEYLHFYEMSRVHDKSFGKSIKRNQKGDNK